MVDYLINCILISIFKGKTPYLIILRHNVVMKWIFTKVHNNMKNEKVRNYYKSE